MNDSMETVINKLKDKSKSKKDFPSEISGRKPKPN